MQTEEKKFKIRDSWVGYGVLSAIRREYVEKCWVKVHELERHKIIGVPSRLQTMRDINGSVEMWVKTNEKT